MRKPHRVDGNQTALTAELRQLPGISVLIMSQLGHGAPDLCVGYKARNYMLEVKDPDKPKSKRALTPDEEKWHLDWNGQINVVETLEDVLRVIGYNGVN